jgi:hypothetical protein
MPPSGVCLLIELSSEIAWAEPREKPADLMGFTRISPDGAVAGGRTYAAVMCFG